MDYKANEHICLSKKRQKNIKSIFKAATDVRSKISIKDDNRHQTVHTLAIV